MSRQLNELIVAQGGVRIPASAAAGKLAQSDASGNVSWATVASLQGTSSSTFAAGNDSRLSDARTPTAHASTHQPSGSDAMAVDAAAGTGSLRTIGKTALKAADGADTEYAFSSWRVIVDKLYTGFAAGTVAGTYLPYGGGHVILGGANSSAGMFYLDPADYASGTRTAKIRVRGTAVTNTVAPVANFTIGLYPISTFGGGSNLWPTITALGTATVTVAFNGGSNLAASTAYHAESTATTCPAAGYYVLAIVNSATTAANSIEVFTHRLEFQQV